MKRLISLLIVLILAMIPLTGALAEILQLSDSGDAVLAIQNRLAELGYTETETDGVFGEGTQSALAKFQYMNGLLETGIADNVTQRILMSEDALAYDAFEDYSLNDGNEVALTECGDMVISATALSDPGLTVNGYTKFESPMDTREYTTFKENGFQSTATSPLSTFAADVDTASWSEIRQLLLRGEEVPADSVRIEEMLNYFKYDYKTPAAGEPFGVTMEMDDCPWQEGNKLLLIGLQAEEIETSGIPENLVFLIDVSGSMDDADKLPLAKRAFTLLLDELQPDDTVSIVTYASNSDVVLDGVPAANEEEIMEAIDGLFAAGSTNGGEGILTAYALAKDHFVEGGVNRIILATDGDLNVGITSEGELARMVSEQKQAGISLTVLGFGGNNYKDNRLEALADYGDGNYWYIDTIHEARRALVTEGGGTFNTVAKDVKLQLDFNPAKVKGYRLIGYEDRLLDAEDFADDSVDGGEIGSGHRVTALYEIVPADSDFDFGETQSKYQTAAENAGDEWLTLSIRAKEPDGDESKLYTYPITSEADVKPGENLRFAAGVAELGMLLRGSEWSGTATYESALELLRSCESVSGDTAKEELVYLAGVAAREKN